MNKHPKIGLALVLILVALGLLLLYLSHTTVAILSPRGPIAYQERRLIIFGLLLSLVVIVPVFSMAALIGWRYRETNTRATYKPDWDHSWIAETVWWGIPALLITILSVVAWNSSHSLDPARPLSGGGAPPLTIQVVALDWKWLFIYPQQHVAAVNTVEFPVGAPVDFQITSDAPMNSFWIPQLGGQIYAMPGMVTQLHLMASAAGSFYGASANISGRGFADMHFTARALSDRGFTQWVAAAKRSPHRLNSLAYQRLARPSVNNLPAVYALEQTSLFDAVVSKYMTPAGANSMYMPMAGLN